MSSLHIREIFDKSVDFFKAHYEYLLPFSLLYFLLQLPPSIIKSVWMTPLSVLVIPLGFSIPYFTDKVLRGTEKSFGLFFEIYSFFFKYFGFTLIRGLIILILLSPFLYSFIDVMKEYNYDMEKINQAMMMKTIHFSKNSLIMMGISMLLVLFSLPFILFPEFYGILDGYGFGDSFTKAYEAGAKHYFKIFGIVILSVFILFAGLCACCIGLIFALPIIYLMYYFAYRTIEPLKG